MGRKLIAIFALLAIVMWSGDFVRRARAQSPAHGAAMAAPQSGKTAEQQFKNIQVLKGVPADQLIPTMQFITASLGVECEFCHVQNAFEKDDKKPKQMARKMIEMMIAINADNFEREREVTCYTCHRGNAKPVAMPPVMTAAMEKESMPEAEPEEAKEIAGPPADELIAKYVHAVGGAAAIDKVHSRVMKGSIDFGGKSFPIDIYSKAPDARISYTHMPEGDSVTAFNGHEGWLGMPGGRLREMHGGDLDGASIDADLHLATDLKQMFSAVDTRKSGKIDDRETYEVIGQREGKPPIELYFDAQSGLLLRLVRYGETALGRLPTQIDYADYHEVSGVKIPYRWTLARPSGRFTIQVIDVKDNIAVDDAKFVKPAPPEPPKGPAK